jgi:hypothetical protein
MVARAEVPEGWSWFQDESMLVALRPDLRIGVEEVRRALEEASERDWRTSGFTMAEGLQGLLRVRDDYDALVRFMKEVRR